MKHTLSAYSFLSILALLSCTAINCMDLSKELTQSTVVKHPELVKETKIPSQGLGLFGSVSKIWQGEYAYLLSILKTNTFF